MKSPTADILISKSHIAWSVTTQINNDKYIIEHSRDGTNFSSIGEIDGDGNNTSEKHYAYTHDYPTIGINYYRIKQVDYDGQYSYSDIASVRNDGNSNISIYPNPTTSEVSIRTSVSASLKIMDVYGRILSKQEIQEGQSTINLGELPSGNLIFVVGDQRYRVFKK